jgi:hypothetical protein
MNDYLENYFGTDAIEGLTTGLSDTQKNMLIGLFNRCKSDYSESELFTDPFFSQKLPMSKYDFERVHILLWPYLRRCFGLFFINIPSETCLDESKISILKYQFNLNHCVNHFITSIRSDLSSLDNFKNIDIYPKLLELISENYYYGVIDYINSLSDSEIEELKIISKRDNKINQITI